MRSNGNIIVTLIQSAELWEINPNVYPADAHFLFRFPEAISALGIAEIEPDVFAVNFGNWSDKTDSPQSGSWSIWRLNLNERSSECSNYGEKGSDSVTAKKIGDIPEAVFLNGLTVLPGSSDLVMSADSGAGVVYRFNWKTGAYSTAVDNAVLKPNHSVPFKLGVNGIQVSVFEPNALYAINSLKKPAFFRIPIDLNSGSQVGAVEVIVDEPSFLLNIGGATDDFALERDECAWITSDISNSLYLVSLTNGAVDLIAGGANSYVLAGDTSCMFGVTKADQIRGRLFIVTNGGLAYPPSSGIMGGRVLALDIVDLQL